MKEKTNKIIRDTENLIRLISRSGGTISNRKIKQEVEKWLENYYSKLLNELFFSPTSIEALEYLKNSIQNQRLIKKKWVRNLGLIKKSLYKLKFDNKEERILFFDPNKPFTAYKVLEGLFSKVQKKIIIYDGYVEEGTLDILSSIPKTTEIKILTNNTYGNFLKELKKFMKEFPNCETRKSSIVHDRFFFLDEKCFVSGISLHALGGRKPSFIFEVSKDIASILKDHFEHIWNQAIKLP